MLLAEIKNRRKEILNRIAARCIIVDTGWITPCYLWNGPTSGDGRGGGYGRMSLDGQTVAVHIVVATHYFGYIPGKKQVDHLCNQRRCANPAHLEIVTHLANQKRRSDRSKKGNKAA